MSPKEWFVDWFDSPYYHLLYGHRDETEAQAFISRLITYLRPPTHAKALDLACGKGRHSKVLSELGLDVLGVDLSPNSIEQAKQFKNDRLSFAVHDMRNPLESGAFQYVFNLFTSFGYFDQLEDNLKVIESVWGGLSKDGLLIIDFMNAEKVVNNLVHNEHKTLSGIDFQIERQVKDGKIIKSIRFSDAGQDFHFEEKVQALTLSDFKQLLSGHFQLLETFGNYRLQPFDPSTSDRLILVARKC